MNPQNRTRTLFVGGASGMSKATARLLLEDGGAVVLLGRQRAKLVAAQRELRQIGRVDIEVLDITDAAAVTRRRITTDTSTSTAAPSS